MPDAPPSYEQSVGAAAAGGGFVPPEPPKVKLSFLSFFVVIAVVFNSIFAFDIVVITIVIFKSDTTKNIWCIDAKLL